MQVCHNPTQEIAKSKHKDNIQSSTNCVIWEWNVGMSPGPVIPRYIEDEYGLRTVKEWNDRHP